MVERNANPFSMAVRDYDLNPYLHPQVFKGGYAGHLIDKDGNDYVDFLSAWGSNLLGYNYRKVVKATVRQAKRFANLGLPYGQYQDLMRLMVRIVPWAESVRFGKNGSDVCRPETIDQHLAEG